MRHLAQIFLQFKHLHPTVSGIARASDAGFAAPSTRTPTGSDFRFKELNLSWSYVDTRFSGVIVCKHGSEQLSEKPISI